MSSSKRLHVTIRKHGNPIELSSAVDKLVPLLTKYSSIIISMQGFNERELLETIRPLVTRNVWTTLLVHKGEDKSSEEYDEKIVIP